MMKLFQILRNFNHMDPVSRRRCPTQNCGIAGMFFALLVRQFAFANLQTSKAVLAQMRIRRHARYLFAIVSVFFSLGLITRPSLAQTTVLPPPVTRSVDSNGVDLISGTFMYPAPSISTVGISETPVGGASIFMDNWTGVLNSSADANGSYLTVSIGGVSEQFKSVGNNSYTA